MNQSESKLLIEKIALQDCQASYECLFKDLYPILYRFALNYLKDSEQAEELASDVLFDLWTNRTQLLEITNIKAYAYVMVKNRVLNIFRKNKIQTRSLEDLDVEIQINFATPEQALIRKEFKHRVEAAVNSLPPKAKLVYQLIRMDGLSYRETAELLGISSKTVDAHMVAAMKKMTDVLRNSYDRDDIASLI